MPTPRMSNMRTWDEDGIVGRVRVRSEMSRWLTRLAELAGRTKGADPSDADREENENERVYTITALSSINNN
eukprot:scaffold174151_cov40-Tisochrysis_lutea.AAC.1